MQAVSRYRHRIEPAPRASAARPVDTQGAACPPASCPPETRHDADRAGLRGGQHLSQTGRIHLFVAAHVAAVGGIYALALVLGGGLASPPFPPDIAHRAAPAASGRAAAAPAVAGAGHGSPARAGLPEWAARVEASAPWEARP